MNYPKWKYHPDESPAIVKTPEEEKAHFTGWFDSPADFGVESCPGVRLDREIVKKKKPLKTGEK